MKTLSGYRLEVFRRADGVYIWTNGRTLGFNVEEAEQLLLALQAVLHEGHDEAFTLDTLEPIRRAAPEIPALKPSSWPKSPPAVKPPTLDMI